MTGHCIYTLCLLLFCQTAFAQKADTLDFFEDIGNQDVTMFILVSNQSVGFGGHDYQRFYIHFISVQRSAKNRYQYLVKGRTKLKEGICTFTGTITIKMAITFKVEENDEEIPKDIRQGRFTASLALQEDKSQYGSGTITGTLTKVFIIKAGKMMDGTPLYYGDMLYEGNCFQGQWTSNRTGKSKVRLWHNGGGWTMRQDLFRLGDGGGVYINLQYLKIGWENDATA